MESRIFRSNDITVVTFDIITPFNLSASFLYDFNRVTVWNAWEWQFGNFHSHRLLTLTYSVFIDNIDEMLVICDNLAPNVVNHPLLNSHYVFIIHPSAFDIEGNEFVQVAVCVVFFCTKGRPYFEYSFRSHRGLPIACITEVIG